MITKRIPLPEKTKDYIQRLTYDYEMRRDNLCYLIFTYKDDVTFLESDIFKKYESTQAEAKAVFELAKMELTAKFLPIELKNKNVNWFVDFLSSELVITAKE